MSILRGFFDNKDIFIDGNVLAQQEFKNIQPDLNENQLQILDSMQNGLTLADLADFSGEEKEALLELGCRLTLVGEFEKATDILLKLVTYDPLEERGYYALGVIAQSQGKLQKAAQLYLMFLSLDATNSKGYLRLAECLFENKEYAEARSALIMASTLAVNGNHPNNIIEEANKLLKHPLLRKSNIKKNIF